VGPLRLSFHPLAQTYSYATAQTTKGQKRYFVPRGFRKEIKANKEQGSGLIQQVDEEKVLALPSTHC